MLPNPSLDSFMAAIVRSREPSAISPENQVYDIVDQWEKVAGDDLNQPDGDFIYFLGNMSSDEPSFQFFIEKTGDTFRVTQDIEAYYDNKKSTINRQLEVRPGYIKASDHRRVFEPHLAHTDVERAWEGVLGILGRVGTDFNTALVRRSTSAARAKRHEINAISTSAF